MGTEQSVTVIITCQIEPDKMEVARQEFTAIIATVVAKEAACHGIHLHEDVDAPNRLFLVEYWESKEAFTGPHMQTPHMQVFLERTKEFLAGTPEFRFGREIAAAP